MSNGAAREMTLDEALAHLNERHCARAEVARLRAVAEAGVRLHFDKYIHWANAGGENECPHGIGRGLACRICDIATIRRDGLAAALDGGEGK